MFFNKKRVVLVFTFLFMISTAFAIDDLMALQGSVNSLSGDSVYGNVTVQIYDDATAGNLIYDSGNDFLGTISKGQYDIMLVSGSNKMNLTFGKKYFCLRKRR